MQFLKAHSLCKRQFLTVFVAHQRQPRETILDRLDTACPERHLIFSRRKDIRQANYIVGAICDGACNNFAVLVGGEECNVWIVQM